MKFENIKKWIIKHKKTSTLLLLLVVFIIYKIIWGGTANSQTHYVTSTVEKGSVIASITGTGQVSASNRVDVTSEVAGDITYVPVKLGSVVTKGQILASVDSRDANRAVQNAEISLENAKIAYEKAQNNAGDQSVQSSKSDINKAYEEAYTDVSNVMIDIPDIVDTLDAIYYNNTHSPYFGDINAQSYGGQTAIDYKYESGRLFDKTKSDFDEIFKTYRSVNISNRDKLTELIEDTNLLVKNIYTVLTSTYNTIDYIKNRISNDKIPSEIAIDKNTISSDLSVINGHITNLSNTLTDIEDAKDSSTEATLDLKTAELNLSTAEDNLRKAKDNLANHSTRAPFGGVVGKIDVEVGDRISTNGEVATIITDEKIAEITLNEVDVSKVKIDQKATLTFDAVEDLTITGTVTEIDLLGTVSQGVVNYTIKITFDVNDDRIKTGMSLSAAIISETKQNVVRVPNSAVKNQSGESYVERLTSGGAVIQIPVQVGLSNDEYTEITSGLTDGDLFVSRTITSASNTTTQAPSLFGGGGTRSLQGGGNVRFQTR